jgi:hypothetical protein
MKDDIQVDHDMLLLTIVTAVLKYEYESWCPNLYLLTVLIPCIRIRIAV